MDKWKQLVDPQSNAMFTTVQDKKKNSSDIKLPVSQLESDVQEAHAQEVE